MPKRRPDSNALRLLSRELADETPMSLIASAKRQAPAATTITTYPIERALLTDTTGKRQQWKESVRGSSITAAAAQLNGSEERGGGRKTPRRRKRSAEKWQNEIWDLRDESPELRFLGDRQARAASQVRMYIGHHKAGDVGDPDRITEGPAGELAQQLFGNIADVEQKIKRYVQQIVFTGESIVNVRNDELNQLMWSVHSSSELLGSQSGQYQITDGVTPRKVDDANEILARSWTPHPKLAELADAPVRALLPVLRELVQMSKYVSAQIDSKLASGGGVLFVSQDVELFDPDGNRLTFATELQEYMMTAVEDRASAESLAPMVATVPSVEGRSMADVAHLLTFDDVLDPHMHERRQEAIRRIALGMDSDPGVLDGAGTMNHWSAWSLDEAEIKLGVAPIMTTFCHTLTSQVVRPLLTAAGVENANEFSVWFDTSALKLRPDRSKDSQWAHEKGMLSESKTLIEHGFDDNDMPTPEERSRRLVADNLAVLLAQYSTQPDVVAQLLAIVGVQLTGIEPAAAPAAVPVGGTAPAAEPVQDLDNSPPDTMNDPAGTAPTAPPEVSA